MKSTVNPRSANENGHRPKKHLGQHFLTAQSYAKRIADAVPAGQNDNVLEIGPGQGALSVFLKQRFPRFHLVEIDTDVLDRLRSKLGPGDYTIHHGDILKFDFSTVGFPLHVTGNLPYSIGALIIKKTLLYGNNIRSCTFMVQREVAERIASGPHSKENGFLTIFCQFFGTPHILFNVPPGAFFPPPKIDSAVFQIIVDENLEQKLPREKWQKFFKFVDRGFSMRRKQLAKVLAFDSGTKQLYADILEGIGIRGDARPEDLDISQWLEFYKRFELHDHQI